MPRGQDHYPYLPTPHMPQRPPRRPPRRQPHDRSGRGIPLLAWNHKRHHRNQGEMCHLQQQRPLHTTRRFLVDWGVHHRIASAYHPHANCRGKVAVKTIKRLLAGNTGPGGALTDRFHKALLQYRNSPDLETRMSPAACLFGRPSSPESPTDTVHTRNGLTASTYENELYPNDPCQTAPAGTSIPRDSPPSSAGTQSWYKIRWSPPQQMG